MMFKDRDCNWHDEGYDEQVGEGMIFKDHDTVRSWWINLVMDEDHDQRRSLWNWISWGWKSMLKITHVNEIPDEAEQVEQIEMD